jgi:hypothetical protein
MPSHGNTSQRGYGAAHQAQARALKAALVDGDLCCRCSRPLYRWQLTLDRNDPRGIDADHYTQARALGGELPDALAHRLCNRSAGATLGNRLRGAARRTPPAPRPPLPEW